MWLLILSVLAALLISASCSLMEATLLSLRPGQIADLAKKNARKSEIWQQLKSKIERPIASILILNTAAHTIGASVAGAEFDRVFGSQWIWVFSLVFTFLMLQFTEILPKSAGVRYNQWAAYWIARPLLGLVRLMAPFELLIRWLNRPFSRKVESGENLNPTKEILALTGFAHVVGEISDQEAAVIERGTRLSRNTLRAIMRPRVDIDAIDIETPADEVLGAVAMAGFARLPVYEKDLDHILGFIYIKDLILEIHMGRPIELQRLLRPAIYVPDSMRWDRLLETFRREHTQMAVVLDEHGGTQGLVTLEDVLEELVGTIHDEYRQEASEIHRRDDGRWVVHGSAGVEDLLEAVGRSELIGEIPREVNSLGGLVQMQLDRIASEGDRTTWRFLSLEVTRCQGFRVEEVLVEDLRRRGTEEISEG